MKCLFALLVLGLLLVSPTLFPVSADVGGDQQPGTDLETLTEIDKYTPGLSPAMSGEITFTGTVLGQDRQAIPDIDVKLFIGGLLAESHNTDSVGQYNFVRTIDFSRDETVLIWFVDPGRQLAPKAFVLSESKSADEHGLLSPCFPRLQVEDTVESTIYLFDPETKAEQIGERNCI